MPDSIVVQNLGKRFCRYHPDRPRTLKETFVRGLRRMGPVEQFWALRDVSFGVAAGTMMGVIGRNGAGKSTLLRLIAGVGRPDEGTVEVQGRLGAFLDLAAGFRPDLTGRENVFIGGVIAGLTRREVAQKLDSIVSFAELEESIDSPLRTYSTGMRMRLAFAIATHTEPEVLLIDEVLAVGDLAFRSKCFDRIQEFKRDGCTILLVSHDVNQIQILCDKALWLHRGRLVAHGAPEIVVGQYTTEMRRETRRRTPTEHYPTLHTPTNSDLHVGENRFGSLELQITRVQLFDRKRQPVTELDSGEPLSIEVDFLAPNPIPSPIFSVAIASADCEAVYTSNTAAEGLVLPTIQGKGQIALHLGRLDLVSGQYEISVGAFEQEWSYAYDYHWCAYSLLIRRTKGKKGILYPPHSWELKDLLDTQNGAGKS